MNFLETMHKAMNHFQQEDHFETTSNLDESVMNAYREVVPKA